MRSVPLLYIEYLGICLTTEENHGNPQSGYVAFFIQTSRCSTFPAIGLLADLAGVASRMNSLVEVP